MRFQPKPDTSMNGQWHNHFALFPVTSKVTGTIMWLETVGRRWYTDEAANYAGDSSCWEYIEIEKALALDA